MSTQDHWPDEPGVERRGRLPDDLVQANLDAALQELFYRFRDKKARDGMSTAMIARVVKDLAGLKLAERKADTPQPERVTKSLNVLMLVDGLPKERQLEVLRQAVDGAEHPEPIRAAIRQLEVTNGVGEEQRAGGTPAARN